MILVKSECGRRVFSFCSPMTCCATVTWRIIARYEWYMCWVSWWCLSSLHFRCAVSRCKKQPPGHTSAYCLLNGEGNGRHAGWGGLTSCQDLEKKPSLNFYHASQATGDFLLIWRMSCDLPLQRHSYDHIVTVTDNLKFHFFFQL